MTLTELSRTLPNGFHDAELNGIRINFSANVVYLDISLDISSTHDAKAVLKQATIMLTGMKGLIFQVPEDATQDFSEPLDVSGAPVTNFENVPPVMRSDGMRKILYGFFIDDWNSTMYVAAERADLVWAVDP